MLPQNKVPQTHAPDLSVQDEYVQGNITLSLVYSTQLYAQCKYLEGIHTTSFFITNQHPNNLLY